MKKHIYFTGIWIAVVLLAMIVACNPPKEKDTEPIAKPLSELSAIDSLMWRQPDSAFARLQEFVVSPEAKDLDEFNGHYCQLLISELLYKNYYGQSNREELLKAVHYFDSIVGMERMHTGKRTHTVWPYKKVCPYRSGMRFWRRGRIILMVRDCMNGIAWWRLAGSI